MKLPICTVDAKTGSLCRTCRTKIENNEITQKDIDFSKAIIDMVGKYPILNKAKFFRAIKLSRNDWTEIIKVDLEESEIHNLIAKKKCRRKKW